MGKIILEFDSIEEADDARDALNAFKWKNTVRSIDDLLRKRMKYDEEINPEVYKEFEGLREYISDELSEEGLTLN